LVLDSLRIAAAPPASDWDRLKIPEPKGYVCHRAAIPLRIDGKLNEEEWQNARWTEEFQDIEGKGKAKPRFRTRAKMLWDDTYFYVAAELEEPHVSGSLTNHDSVIFHDNDFELFLDPNGDNHEYFEIEINALNTEWDLFLKKPYKDGGPAADSWEIPGLKTAVQIDGSLNDPHDTDKGWTVELALPWKVLGEYAHRPAPPRHGDQWRINFSRVEWKYEIVEGKYKKVANTKEDNWVWSPQGIIDMHRPEKWGYVQFSADQFDQPQFRPDSSARIQDILHHVYYAQQEFRKLHGRWAPDLQTLGFSKDALPDQAIKLRLSESGFTASAEITSRAGTLERWHIEHDSRIWKE
jgi:hypothetical protein